MRKFRLLGFTLFAVFALGAVVVSSAFAAAEWLVGGAAVTAELLIETSGELTLIHLAGGFLEPEATIKCSGIFDGAVLPAGLDVISELLTLGGVVVTEANPLSCTKVKTCENGSTVFAQELPWATQLTLMAVGGGSIYLDLFSAGPSGKLPGYLIVCLFLGEQIVLCEGETSATITLDATALLGVFNAKELETEKLEGSCGGTANVALQEGEGTLTLNGGGELDVSE
jgi:hypothetical protein